MFYVNPRAIASLYGEVFEFGRTAEAMYCFTDSMRPLVQGPFSDEIMRFLRKQNVKLLSHHVHRPTTLAGAPLPPAKPVHCVIFTSDTGDTLNSASTCTTRRAGRVRSSSCMR